MKSQVKVIKELRTKIKLLRAKKEYYKQSASHDYLTKLYNRKSFNRFLRKEILRSQRYNRIFSLLFIDVNKFKRYNDEKGHIAGDRLLKKIASTLKNDIRGTNFIARWGGDEFAIILPETNKKRAEILVERLKELPITIGIATYIEDGKTYKTILRKADKNLYKKKRGLDDERKKR